MTDARHFETDPGPSSGAGSGFGSDSASGSGSRSGSGSGSGSGHGSSPVPDSGSGSGSHSGALPDSGSRPGNRPASRSGARPASESRSDPTRWTTPTDLRDRLLRRWDRGDWPGDFVRGTSEFPLEIPLTRPRARDIADRFGQVMDWAAALKAGDRSVRGWGYELRWQSIPNRVQGTNDLPVAAVFPTEADGLRFIGRRSEAKRLRQLAEAIRSRRPALGDWVARRPREVLRHASDWDRLLAVVDWFAANPRPDLYLRQLDIPGVDTKFIEIRRGILTELLDEVLSDVAVDREATGVGRFARRYGLREEPLLIRFRVLDEALAVGGFTDVTVTAEEFARWSPRLGPDPGPGSGPIGKEFVGGSVSGPEVGSHPAASDSRTSTVAASDSAATASAAIAPWGGDSPGTDSSRTDSSRTDSTAAIQHVFITENRINGLAFPAVPGGIVIFGLGYGVERLAEISWLHGVDLWYWGDIDTHGFGILNRLRARLPRVRSFLMDRDTLTAHRELWVQEPGDKRYDGEPNYLTPDEYALFDDLRRDRLGERVRLEQERIPFGAVEAVLAQLDFE